MLPTVRRVLAALTGVAVSVPLVLMTPGSSGAAVGEYTKPHRTTMTLKVIGCDRCTIQPVQNRNGDVPYAGPIKSSTGERDTLRFTVPTRRTSQMAFIIYAPFDEYGIPATAITAFRGKTPGDTISPRYVRKTRTASSCWTGTHRSDITNTIVVRQVKIRTRLLGPGRHKVAAAYFTKTLPSGPYYKKSPKNAAHSSDPSTCK